MRRDQRSVRVLLVLVLVPVVIVAALLATAVLGHGASGGGAARSDAAAAARPAPVAPAPAVPAERATRVPPVAIPVPSHAPAPGAGAASAALREAERIEVGSGAQGATVFRPRNVPAGAGRVVIFLHGWVAIDPERYGAWIGHLVRGGATVIFPSYQTKPARDTITPLINVLAGVRAALAHVSVAPGRLVAVGHSVGGALAADYAAVAAGQQLPVPSAVFSVYPGRRLRHLTTEVPAVDLSTIAPGTRLLALAGERDTAVGSSTARRIVEGAVQADGELRIIRDDVVDDHSAPRRFDGAAQRTFWEPLDALLGATAEPPRGSAATGGAIAG